MMTQASQLFLSTFPGAVSWLLGRSLIRQAGDPLSPERYRIYWQRIFLIGALCFFISLVLPEEPGESDSWSPYPLLLILSILAGSFPSRKILLQETWSFPAFLLFNLRFLLAFPAFTILLMLTPSFITTDSGYSVPSLILLAVLLYGRLFTNVEGVRRILGAHYLEDQALTNRLNAVTARSQVNNPLFLVLPVPGGKFANAFALPALPRPAVIFSQPLLDVLTPEETNAIYAHELGHLEEMDAAFAKKKFLLSLVLVTAALFTVPALATWTDFEIKAFYPIIYGVVIALMQIKIFGHKRHHEADSDARAVELCGNAAALQNALEKLHDINHVPHRWDLNTEKASSHPSLANRKLAINKSAEANPATLAEPVILKGHHTGSFVIFENAAIHWLSRVPESVDPALQNLLESTCQKTTWQYGDVSELYLRPSGQQLATLIGADHQGNQRKFTLPADMILTAKAALTFTDQKISQTGDDKTFNRGLIMSLSGIIAAAAFSLGYFYPVFMVALLCLIRPGYLTLAALGALVLGESIQYILLHPLGFDKTGAGVLLALSAGLYAITYALRQTNLKITTHDRSFWLLLALLAYPIVRVLFLLTLDLMNGEVNFFNLYYLTMKNQAVSIALLGMTGALLVRYYFRGPWKAWLAAIPALALLCLQSPYFGTAFAHDPFAAKPALLTYRSMALSPLKQSEAPATAYGLRLAPGAGRLAYLKTTIDAENEEAKSFIVADFHQHASELAADDLVFVDDRLLLTNTEYPNSLKLWQFTNDSWRQAKTWQLPEAFISTKLRWLDAQKIWVLEGLDYAENAIVKLSGQLDNDQYQVNQYRQTDRPPKANFIWLENDLLSIKLGRKHLNNSAILAPFISFFRADHQSYHEFWLHAQKPHKIATSAVVNLRCDHPVNADGASLITCLYKIDGFTLLSLFNLDTAHLDATVELNDKDAFYNLAGQQNGFVLVTKNSMQLLAVDIRNKTAVALASDNIAIPIQSTAFSEKFAALSFYTGDAAKQIVHLYNLDALKLSR